MSDQTTLDPVLDDLFRSAREELPPEPFTGNVLIRTKSFQTWLLTGLGAILLVLLPIFWVFSAPLQAFALLVIDIFGTPVLSLGEGWVGLLLMPVNNIGSAAVIIVKVARMSWRKISGR